VLNFTNSNIDFMAEALIKLARKSSFKVLKDNRVPLTEVEKAKVMSANAVWHHGPNGERTPAVWKSVSKKTGKTTYISSTHRAYQSHPSVEGAIGIFHKFIKGTA
jgi:hypothetical protein